MTGEITLRGEVMAIGGLKEKLLAAQAAGIRSVVLPKLNRRDLIEIPATAHKGLTLHTVESMDDVLNRVLLPLRPALVSKSAAAKPAAEPPKRPAKKAAKRAASRTLRVARARGARAR